MLILAALLLSGTAQADTAPVPTPAAVPAKPEKKSCRTYGTTGTIMGGKRICHTHAEWNEIDGVSQNQSDHMHDSMRTATRASY